MASAQLNDAQTCGQTQESGLVEDKAAQFAGQSQEKASRAADESSGFLQQTGEQMKSMAQGAVDGVKNTLGVGEDKK